MRITTLILLVAVCQMVQAQKRSAPPQPAPSARHYDIVKDVWQPYEPNGGGFTAKFPGVPRQSQSTIDLPFGKTVFNSHRIVNNVVVYELSYFDFPNAITDEEQIKVRYATIAENIIKDPHTKLLNQLNSKNGAHSGIQLVYEKPGVSIAQRFILANQRLFQLTLIMPRRISALARTARDQFDQTAATFFDSFAVTNIPALPAEVPQLPINFGLNLNDNSFSSEYLGFKVELPSGWIPLASEESEFYKQAGTEILKERNAAASNQLNASSANTKILYSATKLPLGTANNANLAIGVERIPIANYSLDALNKASLKFFVEKLGYETVDLAQVVKINNANFGTFKVFNKQSNIKQKFFMTYRKGLSLQIVLTYVNDADAQVIENLIKSIVFDK